MAHALQSNPPRILEPADWRKTNPIIGNGQMEPVKRPMDRDLDDRSMRMTVNVHQSFLHNAQDCDRDRIIDGRIIPGPFEGRVNAGSPAEP